MVAPAQSAPIGSTEVVSFRLLRRERLHPDAQSTWDESAPATGLISTYALDASLANTTASSIRVPGGFDRRQLAERRHGFDEAHRSALEHQRYLPW